MTPWGYAPDIPPEKSECLFCGKSVAIYDVTTFDESHAEGSEYSEYQYRECGGSCGPFRITRSLLAFHLSEQDRRLIADWLKAREDPHGDDVVGTDLLHHLGGLQGGA